MEEYLTYEEALDALGWISQRALIQVCRDPNRPLQRVKTNDGWRIVASSIEEEKKRRKMMNARRGFASFDVNALPQVAEIRNAQIARRIAMWQSGMSFEAVGQAEGVSGEAIRSQIKRYVAREEDLRRKESRRKRRESGHEEPTAIEFSDSLDAVTIRCPRCGSDECGGHAKED